MRIGNLRKHQRNKEAFNLAKPDKEMNNEIIKIKDIIENEMEPKVPSIKELFDQRRKNLK